MKNKFLKFKDEDGVTIIMATYNRAHYIEETLNSIINQSFKNWECLIIDDGSTDNTIEILKPILAKDNRIKYFERNHAHKKGLPGCRNYGLELASNNYIIFFDDDDIVHPDNLKICVKLILQENVTYVRYLREVFVGEFLIDFDRSNSFKINSLTLADLPKVVSGKIPFNSCQILWKKECFKDNFFNEYLMYAEEWECYTRILTCGYEGVSIDKALFFGRKHVKSNTGEYINKNSIRLESHKEAALQVLATLNAKFLLNEDLKKFFTRLSLELGSFKIIKTYLFYTNSTRFERFKYSLGFKFYPIIKPILNVKGKYLKS